MSPLKESNTINEMLSECYRTDKINLQDDEFIETKDWKAMRTFRLIGSYESPSTYVSHLQLEGT